MSKDTAMELRVREALPLVERQARWLHRSYADLIERDELVSHGYIGLRKAAERFDESRGVPFHGFAWHHIHGEMMRAIESRIAIARAARAAASRAAMVFHDDGNVLEDDDAAHRGRLDRYCDVVLAGMLAGVVGQATAMESTRQLDDMSRQREQASLLLEHALSLVDPQHAGLLQRHYLAREPLRTLAVEHEVSYATVRRRHEAALRALGGALQQLLEQGGPAVRAQAERA